MTEPRVPPVLRPELDRLADLLGREFAVDPADLLHGPRSKQVARARFAFWCCLRDRYALSYPELGRMVGYDHTTVLTGIKKARALEEADDRWRVQYLTARNEWLRPGLPPEKPVESLRVA